MSKECLWYDGENACYHLLDFDPDGLSETEVVQKAREKLTDIGLYGGDINRMAESLYLLDVSALKSVSC